jgi:hypothetical protein
MSKGLSRNEANKEAVYCRLTGRTYFQGYNHIRCKLGVILGVKKLSESLQKVAAVATSAILGITQLREELNDYQRREQEIERKRVENEVINGDS